MSFLAYKDKLKRNTLKVYLSAVCHLQITGGLPDPFAGVAFPQLDQVMKGIKRHKAERHGQEATPLDFPCHTEQALVKTQGLQYKNDMGSVLFMRFCLFKGRRNDSPIG